MIGEMQASRLHTSFGPVYPLAFSFLLFLSYWKNMFFFTFSWLVPLSLGLFSTEMVLFDHNQGR
jgi:hypothetical protein